jgi:membrane protease YdiL (CAAX protease family)
VSRYGEKEIMSMFEEKPEDPPEFDAGRVPAVEPVVPTVAGDPFISAAPVPPSGAMQVAQSSLPFARALPDDLRVPWSWAHFIVFLFFAFTSFVVVQTALALYFAPQQRLTPKQYEQYLLNKPQFLFGSNLIWYALIFLFLYVTLAVLRGAPFWKSLGWRPLRASVAGARSKPWAYFFSGCGVAIFVALASSRVHTSDNMPIQELFKSRSNAFLLMAMAVFVAPLVEETVFRGYLYPLFAKSFGMWTSILLTGALFGLMHGTQLGWSWGIVLLLVLVGVIFTFARAAAGTVVASFLLHLGYNSMIAVTTIISTHGFTRMPLH